MQNIIKPPICPAVNRSYKDERGRRVDIVTHYVNAHGCNEFLGLVYEKNVLDSRKSPCRYTEAGRVEYEGHDDPMRNHNNLVSIWDDTAELRTALSVAIRQVEKDFNTRVFFSFDSASGNIKLIPEPGTSPC